VKRAEYSGDGEPSSFGSQIGMEMKGKLTELSANQVQIRKNHSLQLVILFLSFFLSFLFPPFSDIWLEMYSWISPVKRKGKRTGEKVQDKDNPTA